jgi:hypothetical protein
MSRVHIADFSLPSGFTLQHLETINQKVEAWRDHVFRTTGIDVEITEKIIMTPNGDYCHELYIPNHLYNDYYSSS